MRKGQPVESHEMSDQDIQWTRIVELELVPHPDQPRPEITEMDYGMRGGALHMKLRAAAAGYILRKWVWTVPRPSPARPGVPALVERPSGDLRRAQCGAGAGVCAAKRRNVD